MFRHTFRFQKISSRFYSANPRTQVEDPRPPWVYVMSRLLSFTLIPTIAMYSVFFYDFGDREHVFQPVRRWTRRQFFNLAPEEQRLLNASDKSPNTGE
ncbi:hypothetical protein AX14_003243 [Amanita brunnescens Koide BX004]|nr:hypothetical protein AX14_003243 [Amanita brunnescens Koide BX004]